MESPLDTPLLTPDEVREFQALVAEETGVHLSTQDAWNRAFELISLLRTLVEWRSEREAVDRVQTSSHLPT